MPEEKKELIENPSQHSATIRLKGTFEMEFLQDFATMVHPEKDDDLQTFTSNEKRGIDYDITLVFSDNIDKRFSSPFNDLLTLFNLRR